MHKESLSRILVRGPNWLGDAVMCEPAITGLKRIAPESRISLLVKPAVAGLFHGHPDVDRILVYDDKGRHSGLSGKWALAGELRRERFDSAVLFQNAFEAAMLAFSAGIPRRFGYATDGRSILLSDPVAKPDSHASVHQVAYYWNLLRPLGLTGEPHAPQLYVTQEETAALIDRLVQLGVPETDLLIAINPGSTYGSAKRWLPERFAQVASQLCRTLAESQGKPVSVVILGAKGEEELGRGIAARVTVRSAVLSGATSIRQLMAVLKRCTLLVTNDTGPMHIAAAFRVPVVAVFGPTDWRTTAPYGSEHAIVRQPVDCAPCMLRECPIDHRCMVGVTADMVYESALQLTRRGHEASGERQEDVRPSLAPHGMLDGVTVFLDRDGTLNYDPGYLKSPAELKLLPGVAASLARLKAAGARLIVVTNQSGVARGYLTLKDLEAIHARLQGLLEQEGAVLDAIYFCPHHPDDGCRCRKPGRAMVDRAVDEWHIDLDRAYLIGDHVRDMQLARAVGAKPVLVTTGAVDAMSLERLRLEQAIPDKIAVSMNEAVEWIFADAGSTVSPPRSTFREEAGRS